MTIIGTSDLASVCAGFDCTTPDPLNTATTTSRDVWGWNCEQNNRSELFDLPSGSHCSSMIQPTQLTGSPSASSSTSESGASRTRNGRPTAGTTVVFGMIAAMQLYSFAG